MGGVALTRLCKSHSKRIPSCPRSHEAMPVVETLLLVLVIGLPLVGTAVTALKGRFAMAFVSAGLTVGLTGLALSVLEATASGMPELGIVAAYIPAVVLMLGWVLLAGTLPGAKPGSWWWRNRYSLIRQLDTAAADIGLFRRSPQLLPRNALALPAVYRRSSGEVPGVRETLRHSRPHFGDAVLVTTGMAVVLVVTGRLLVTFGVSTTVVQVAGGVAGLAVFCTAHTVLSHTASTPAVIMRHALVHWPVFAIGWVTSVGFVITVASLVAILIAAASASMIRSPDIRVVWFLLLAGAAATVLAARLLSVPALLVRAVDLPAAVVTAWRSRRIARGRAIYLSVAAGLGYWMVVLMVPLLGGSWWVSILAALASGAAVALVALTSEILCAITAGAVSDEVADAIAVHAAGACIRGSEDKGPRRRRWPPVA